MRDNRIFTAVAILILAIWAGYSLYTSYTSPSYCPMENHSIYSYTNLLPILLIIVLSLSLLPRSRPSKPSKSSKSKPGMEVVREAVKNTEEPEVKKNTDILWIIREKPGMTQEELREITGYSASKISAEVKELEQRGLIRREKYGRTYKIYPE